MSECVRACVCACVLLDACVWVDIIIVSKHRFLFERICDHNSNAAHT